MSVRQHYGLGSIVKKAVKGVTKAAKNIVSSDLGKAALLAAGTYKLGGGQFGKLFSGGPTGFSFSNLPGASLFTNRTNLNDYDPARNIFQKALDKFPGGGVGLAGAVGLTGFLSSQGMEAEEIEAIKQDPEALKVYLRQYYKNMNPEAEEKEVEDFVTTQTAEYSTSFATGGRVGFMFGSPDDPALTEYLMKKMREKKSDEKKLGSGLGSLKGMGEADEIVIERDLSKATEPKYDAKDFMIERFQEENIAPKILGEGFQGDDKIFVIETPKGGTMTITEEDYITNFGRVNRRLGSPEEGEGIMMIEEREEIAGGPYTSGNDVKDAFGVWNNSDQGVKELYEGFIDFFKSGDWRDQIQGSKIKTKTKRMASAPDPFAELNNLSISIFNKPYNSLNEMEMDQLTEFMSNKKAEGGPINNIARMDFKVGQGVASLPLRQNKAGVKELDLRSTGGFIPPIGTKEKADDVPAMLSNNEFVFTADAVRAAGGGNVEKGAQRMYDTMKRLESRVG